MMFAPGNFRRDPEGYLGNQAGHFAIGLALSTVLAILSYLAFIKLLKLQFQVWPSFIAG